MRRTKKPTWTLLNAAELNAAYPDTFWIPPADERSGLRVGDYAKLVFEPVKKSLGGERMWVEVVAVGWGYVGKLANDPFVLEGLQLGDLIAFGSEHVADWERKPSAARTKKTKV